MDGWMDQTLTRSPCCCSLCNISRSPGCHSRPSVVPTNWPTPYLCCWLSTSLFLLIRSAFIDHETCTQVQLQTVCGPYTNCTYGIDYPVGLCKVMVRVPVGCSYLFDSIDLFASSKISFKWLVQAFFCWMLTCVYHIYWISIYWSWNLSSDVIENCQ